MVFEVIVDIIILEPIKNNYIVVKIFKITYYY